jgi:hypothetical protein
MSGELNREVPTSAQCSTQGGFFIPSHFNFSIEIKADPELIAVLKALVKIKDQSQKHPETLRALEKEEMEQSEIRRVFLGIRAQEDPDPATKLTREMVEQAVDEYRKKTQKTEQKPAKKLKPGPITLLKHPVPGYKNLMYCEHKGQLHIWYSGSTIKTTWKKIEEVSGKGLKEAGQLIIEIVGKKSVKNKMTALRQFVRAYDAGIVKKSRIIEPEEELEKNFSRFQAEEDPDAAFRPMLTSYSTRPDGNCGKVEEAVE